jgi:hypothetical protein
VAARASAEGLRPVFSAARHTSSSSVDRSTRSRRPAPSRELGNASGVGFEIMLILIVAAVLLIALKQTHPPESGLKRVPQRELIHEVSRSDSRI